MENKKVLGKIIPAILVLVLALLLVITISSCSKSKKTPVGEIIDEENYLKVNLADDKTYSVSKLEFYNKLRYVGYNVFEDSLYEAALNDIVTDIKKDIEDNSSNLSNSKYFKKFKYVIDKEVYGTTDQVEIDDLKDYDREQKEKVYLSSLRKAGYAAVDADGIYQKASFEYQLIKLAKREFARAQLLKDIDEEDSENKITTKSTKEYFNNKIVNRGDLAALVVLFSSQTEIDDTLKQLNLKYIGNKIYRVPASGATYEDPANPKFSEYEKYYDDFDNNKEGISALDDNEVLFEMCRVYNYVYAYRNKLTFVINGVDYLDEAAHPINPTSDTYSDADYKAIKDTTLDDMVALLLAQDTGDLETSPRLVYDYHTLHTIDTALTTALTTKYLFTSDEYPRYNTPSSTFARGNYLTFKLQDGFAYDYDGIDALYNLITALEANDSETVIKAHIESVREQFSDLLLGAGIYSDDAKVKAWAIDYAEKITFDGITGVKDIIKSTKDRENEDSIWAKMFEELLTDEYISEELNEFLEDNCKITIYDQLFEVQFAQKNDFYKAGSKTSKENILKVKVTDPDTKESKENVITAAQMFDKLNQRYGAEQAMLALANEILRGKYYSDRITEEKKKEYETQYDQVISYFAQGNSAQYGYSPEIGQKAFINLYFRADSKEEAIFNMWASVELQNILIYEKPTEINGSIIDYFNTLTNVAYDNFVNIEYNLLYVYTDDDEDGQPDDWTKVDDSDARKQEVKQLAAELINIVNERVMSEYSNSIRDDAYNGIYQKYQSASRVSQLGNYGDGNPLPTFETTAEKEAYYFAQFKSKGLFLGENVVQSVSTLTELYDKNDDAYEAQLKVVYDYMIANHSEDLSVEQIVARKLEVGDSGANIDKATSDNLFEFGKGFGSLYITKTHEANSFKFEVKDNADTSTGSKVYPYSTNEDDPFPMDEDKKPIDNTGQPDSLYNTTDLVSNNQIIVYVREYKDGVESLSLNVVNAFKAYSEDYIIKNYVSNSFRYYALNSLINNEIAAGNVTISDDIKDSMNAITKAYNESIFDFIETDISAKWFEIFK